MRFKKHMIEQIFPIRITVSNVRLPCLLLLGLNR